MPKCHIVGNHKSRLICTFQKGNNKSADQTARNADSSLPLLFICCSQATKPDFLATRHILKILNSKTLRKIRTIIWTASRFAYFSKSRMDNGKSRYFLDSQQLKNEYRYYFKGNKWLHYD